MKKNKHMSTLKIFKISVLFLFVLSVVSCKGNKGGLDNQESDTVMVAKDSIPFVPKIRKQSQWQSQLQ